VTPPNTSLITEMKPSFACKEIIDLTKDECGDVLIEFDQVKVLVTFETLGLLYAMIYSLEAADDDEASHNKRVLNGRARPLWRDCASRARRPNRATA
jgi:hypothetical protein